LGSGHQIPHIALEVGLAALPSRSLEVPPEGRNQTFVLV
jgi:hypothetical protein